MTLKQLAEKAVRECDANAAGKLVDVCRFRFDMRYDEVYEFVNRMVPISLPAWESLLYEADTCS